MREIRYDISACLHNEGYWQLVQQVSGFPWYPILVGTWRECAEKLRELHPGAKLKAYMGYSRKVKLPGNLGFATEHIYPTIRVRQTLGTVA